MHERQLPVSTSPVLRVRAEHWWSGAPPRHVNNRIRTCWKRAATPPNLLALSGKHRHVQPHAATRGPRAAGPAGARGARGWPRGNQAHAGQFILPTPNSRKFLLLDLEMFRYGYHIQYLNTNP